jgi:hypothetical protein
MSLPDDLNELFAILYMSTVGFDIMYFLNWAST